MLDRLASTPQSILQFAQTQPAAAAIIRGEMTVDYRTLAVRLAQVTQALKELPIERGTLVGIECADRFLHLLIALACEIIGAPTVSFGQDDMSPDDDLVALCGFLFVGESNGRSYRQRKLTVTRAWKDAVYDRPIRPQDLACLDSVSEPGQLARIARTSGSTDRAKLIENSHLVQQAWMEKGIAAIRNPNLFPLKFLCVYGHSIRSVHLRMRMALHTGGTVIYSRTSDFFRDCQRFDRICVFLLVYDIQRLVSEVPADFRRPSTCLLQTGGGMLPSQLRQKAKETFATEVDLHYSSNETALVALIDESGVGTLVRGVEAAIIDEHGNERPLGEVGRIKLKVFGMVTRYFRQPELTARTFIDGWFHSSDVGYMPAPGKLVVLGRLDDMLNIGGSKLPAHTIEEQIKGVAGVSDVALMAVANKNGVGEIAAAIEVDQGSDRNYIKSRLQRIFPAHLGPVHVLFTHALPRTDTGKIRRPDVEARLRSTFGTQPPPPRPD